jgi:hypothetical protein
MQTKKALTDLFNLPVDDLPMHITVQKDGKWFKVWEGRMGEFVKRVEMLREDEDGD